jgi:hypothetical protein
MPPTGSPDRHGAGASVCRCKPHGFVILTAKPIAGHHAKGPRREPGQDDPDAAGAQDLDPDRRQAPALDHRRAPLPGRRPCPRTPLQSRPPRPRPPRRSSKRLPETPVSLPGITLSYEGGQGERARSRRYERRERVGARPQQGSRSGNSVSPVGSAEVCKPDTGMWRMRQLRCTWWRESEGRRWRAGFPAGRTRGVAAAG